MTREEAIEQFQKCKELIRQNGKEWLDERDTEILDMAIEALRYMANIEKSIKKTMHRRKRSNDRNFTIR